MATLIIDEELAKKLQLLAEREQRPVEDVLRSMLDRYEPKPTPEQNAALEALIGMFDDDVTDLSTTVRETMKEYYQKKYGDSD
jgi:predicted transcriptional regulator